MMFSLFHTENCHFFVSSSHLRIQLLIGYPYFSALSLQINKLLEIARSVANVNLCGYSSLDYMIEQLDELKYVIQDRKADALVVETFGRRIEKLLQ